MFSIRKWMLGAWRFAFGEHCKRHKHRFRSDFCVLCVREMVVRIETHDVA